jgi:hypothetical protein
LRGFQVALAARLGAVNKKISDEILEKVEKECFDFIQSRRKKQLNKETKKRKK